MKSDSKNKKVYLVRHGESEANISKVFQKWDEKLTNKGKEQASQVSNRLKSEGVLPQKIITTSAKRAFDTAQKISDALGFNSELDEVDLFRECIPPQHILGLPYSNQEAMRDFIEWYESLFQQKKSIQGTESYDHIIKRVRSALKYLEKSKEDTIIVVTHGFFLRTIMAAIMLGENLTPKTFRSFFESLKTSNTGISVIEYSKDYDKPFSWHVSKYNDDAHLLK